MADTPATVFLKSHKIAYTEHEYAYVERGGTEVSAQSLGVPEHSVVKTLVMQDEDAKPLIVLMHGDRKVSTKNLARQAGRNTDIFQRVQFRQQMIRLKNETDLGVAELGQVAIG